MLLRDRVYDSIRRAILTCAFRPGQELREQTLAELYRVSRSPVRDSLLRLELEKLVTVLPRQGYLVNPISIPDVEDMFDLRLLIEPACSAAAALRDDAAVQILDRFRGFSEATSTGTTFFEYNLAFHRQIADLSGNTRMATVANDLAEQFDRLVRISIVDYQMTRTVHLIAEHEAIIDAIQAHDSELAARLTSQHAVGGRSRILTALRQGAAMSAKEVLPETRGGGLAA